MWLYLYLILSTGEVMPYDIRMVGMYIEPHNYHSF